MFTDNEKCIVFMCLFGIWAELVVNDTLKFIFNTLSTSFAIISVLVYILQLIKERK